jgi:flagellar hook-associated protein 3 FlgL
MINSLDASAQSFVANIQRLQNRVADANRQITSGNRVSTPADAPDQISPLLELRAIRAHNQQILTGLGLAKDDADSADSALSTAIQFMDRARTIATQGAGSTTTSDTRQLLAQEVQSLQEEIVNLSGTVVRGQYIFSGDQSGSPMYSFDPTAPNGVVQVTTAGATAKVEDPAGGSVSAAKVASEIFDTRDTTDNTLAAPDNVFAALNNLRLGLLANDTDAIANAGSSLQLASTHLNAMEAFYGDVQTRIQDATTYANQRDVQLQTSISGIQDADPVSAAIELSQANNQLQAAFEARAHFRQNSLFDYLS